MSTVYEYQKVRQRKFVYAGIIALLFVLGLVHRLQVLQVSATENNLEVSNLGQVDMGGELSRYLLASFRGPLICGMWWEAQEKQARHEFDKMEIIIEALNKLQPHFKGPWRFQGWNLAYNVSVEFDRVQDKYFYIARGVRWLYEGDRINVAKLYDPDNPGQNKYRLVGDPDLRKELAYTIENKMDRADEAEFFRCFLQLNCIDPVERQRAVDETEEQYRAKLERFLVKYKILARRIQQLHDVPDGDHAQLLREVRTFLEEYNDSERRGTMPSRYEALGERKEQELRQRLSDPALTAEDRARINRELREARKPFPVWPPGMEPRNFSLEEEVSEERFRLPGDDTDEPVRNYVQDGFDIARRWYEYAQEPLPPPNKDWSKDFDIRQSLSTYHRVQIQGTTMNFRSFPPKMRARLARALSASGWKEESIATWRQTFREWLAFGVANGLEPTEEEWAQLAARTDPYIQYCTERGADPTAIVPDLAPDSPEYKAIMDGRQAYFTIQRIRNQQGFAHYPYWHAASRISAHQRTRDDIAEARHRWYRASRLRSDPAAALAEYAIGFEHWRKVLGRPPRTMVEEEMLADMVVRPLLTWGSPMWSVGQFAVPYDIGYENSYIDKDQAQQELANLQVEFQLQRARRHAPIWMGYQHAAIHLGQALSPLAWATPASYAVTETVQQAHASWVTLERVEDWLEDMPGPFDPYFSLDVSTKHMARERATGMRSFRRENIPGLEAIAKPESEMMKGRSGPADVVVPSP